MTIGTPSAALSVGIPPAIVRMMKTKSKIYREQGRGKECVRAPKFPSIFACTGTGKKTPGGAVGEPGHEAVRRHINSVFILDQAENLKQTAETDAVVNS